MHIECFAYFYKVAMAKSISKVASSSHISQSALSQQIQKLEESLDQKLLIRSNKGVELTEVGNIVLKYSDGSVCVVNYFSVGNRQLAKENLEVHFDGKSIQRIFVHHLKKV